MSALDSIIEKINASSDKGTLFEKLCLYFLRNDPTQQSRFSDVWPWREWPHNNGEPDTGIDIAARVRDSESYCAVQCKFREDDSSISKAEIDSFLALSSKEIFSARIIFTLTDNFNTNARNALTGQSPSVTILTRKNLEESNIDWSTFDFSMPGHVKHTVKTLKDHQINAINDVLNGLAKHDRGKLIMACGTGKTFTSLKIAEKFAGKGGSVLVLVPSISLMNQTVIAWNNDHDNKLPLIQFAVCSDSTVGRYPEEDLSPADLAYEATTDAESLISTWNEKKTHISESMTVIFSTYQSLHKVKELQDNGFPVFDLAICDEAHRTAGVSSNNDDANFQLIHDDSFIHARKRLYMTATPKVFGDTPARKEAIRKKAEENNAVLYSMDDEKIYGPEFHTLSFKKAIEGKLLTDYKVIIFMVEKGSDDDPDLPAKIQGVRKALAKDISPADFDFIQGDEEPMKRAVAFSNTIKASQEFTNNFPQTESAISCGVKHIDGTLSASKRAAKIHWLASDSQPGECRILSNARCLSEGVDVPALDAVIFLNPRSSQIDIVQSIGRVMRKSEGKNYGYVILPVIVNAEESPEKALDKNERYQVVWKVLQALRAHDERFTAIVNSIELRDKVRVTTAGGDSYSLNDILAEKYREEIYIRLVRKCGGGYWESWIKDFVAAFKEISARITSSAKIPGIKERFDSFTDELKSVINPSVNHQQAVEMLAQHITSKEIFDAIFSGFSSQNPISKAMQEMRKFIESNGIDLDPKGLEDFDSHIRTEAAKADTGAKKQELLRKIYNDFFKNAFPETAEKLGIVYTPLQIVDFILRSADWAARHELGITEGLGAKGVHILDPFSGTGTFTARLIQLGLIPLSNLGLKYQEEIHANELLLIAYYISAVNIEASFSQACGVNVPFMGMVLADTFRLNKDRTPPLMGKDKIPLLYEDGRRAYEEETTDIHVIIGNPPYNVSGKIPDYKSIDEKISGTYSEDSDATNKSSLYDSYIRAIRWASDRVHDKGGIVCFVTNASFIDGAAMDGMRYNLAKDFTSIYVFNLRGNANTSGELRRNEAGNVFADGTKLPIAITLFVRDVSKASPNHKCGIWYYECADGMKQEEKLLELEERVSFGEMMREGIMRSVAPDDIHSWINQLSESYRGFFSLGSKKKNSKHGTRPTIFDDRYSRGVESGCDALHCNFSRDELCANIKAKYPDAVISDDTVRDVLYSPYVRMMMYFSDDITYRVYQMPQIFPKHDTKNLLICVTGVGSKYFSAVMVNRLPALTIMEKSQCFPLYWYEETKSPLLGVHKKQRDGISDSALRVYRERYGDEITKEDIFFYIYGVLSSREYALRFGNDTRKALARVPFVKDAETFREFSRAGRELGALHVNYESAEEFPVNSGECGVNSEGMRITRMKIAEESGSRVIHVTPGVTLREIPACAWEYRVNGRSALEWIVERYKDDTDKTSGIRNDCNEWGGAEYVVSLIRRVVTVSVETVRILEGLPELGV